MQTETASDGAGMAKALGWFSIALGAAEIAAPNMLSRAIGLRPDRRSQRVFRAMGLREVLAGIAILMRPRGPRRVWSRVAGDALDLALLGTAALTRRNSGPRVAGALAAVAGVTALDVVAGRRVQRAFDRANRPVMFAVTIAKPPMEVYDFYRALEQLPMFMDHLDTVTQTGPRTSHWVARLPLGGRVEWDAEIIEDIPGRRIVWVTTGDAPAQMRGVVTFEQAPARDSTEVTVEMESNKLVEIFAKPQIKGDLRRLKQVLETGEVLQSDASLHTLPHPAQPSGETRFQ